MTYSQALLLKTQRVLRKEQLSLRVEHLAGHNQPPYKWKPKAERLTCLCMVLYSTALPSQGSYRGFLLRSRLSRFHDELNMIAMIGTSDQLCWLAETCKSHLLLFSDTEFVLACLPYCSVTPTFVPVKGCVACVTACKWILPRCRAGCSL